LADKNSLGVSVSSFLTRYKKPGGLVQLLHLIEASELNQQAQLLDLIASEDPGWAHLVRLKCLSVGRVIMWPLDVLAKVLQELPTETLATLYKSLPHEHKDRILIALTPKEINMLQVEASNDPIVRPEEVYAARTKLFQMVRSLEGRRVIRFEEFDPSLHLEKRLIA
jgi:flagellar motor switch protein FliG